MECIKSSGYYRYLNPSFVNSKVELILHPSSFEKKKDFFPIQTIQLGEIQLDEQIFNSLEKSDYTSLTDCFYYSNGTFSSRFSYFLKKVFNINTKSFIQGTKNVKGCSLKNAILRVGELDFNIQSHNNYVSTQKKFELFEKEITDTFINTEDDEKRLIVVKKNDVYVFSKPMSITTVGTKNRKALYNLFELDLNTKKLDVSPTIKLNKLNEDDFFNSIERLNVYEAISELETMIESVEILDKQKYTAILKKSEWIKLKEKKWILHPMLK
jgi:hypothetical protein